MATFKPEVQKQRKDGTFAVKILLTHNGKLKRLPMFIHVTKDDMTRSGKIKNREVLDKLDEAVREYRRKANRLSLEAGKMDIDSLAAYLCEPESRSLDFINVFKEYILENKEKKGISNYKSALNSLIRFIGREHMDFSEVTVPFLQKYAASLGSGRALSLYLGSIRHVHSWAKLKYNDEERGRICIPYSPFMRFKVPRQNMAEKRALDVEAMRRIIALPDDATVRGKGKSNRFNLAKDCFILPFGLIGMNSPTCTMP